MKAIKYYKSMIITGGVTMLLLLVWATYAARQLKPDQSLSPMQQAYQNSSSTGQSSQLNDHDWVGRGDRFMQQARSTQSAQDYNRAEAAYQQALNTNASNLEAILGMAWVHSVRHEFELSIKWARRAIALQPESPKALGLWGDALVEMGDYNAAFQKYQMMLDQRPDLSSYSRGAHLLFLAGDTARALRLMRTAIDAGGPHYENIAWCRAQLALMLHRLGKDREALSLLDAALPKAPHDFHLLTAMARVKAALLDYPTAIKFYKKSIESVPRPATIVELGDLYLAVGQQREARKQFRLAESIWRLKKSTGRPNGRPDIMSIRYRVDHDTDLDQALAEARRLYKTRKNIVVADTLAWACYKKGLYGQARQAIGEALRLNSPDARIRFHAGMIYAQTGDEDTARKYLRSALNLNPNFHPVLAPQAAKELDRLVKKG